MKWENPQQHLSRISTLWTLVRRAHGEEPEVVTAAQREMLERYSGAIHRYLLGSLRDSDAADELFQEFCVRFLRGEFRNASADRGRFRDFVKTAVFHLIIDHHKRRKKQLRPLAEDVDHPAVVRSEPRDSEREFLNSWRDELIARSWLALDEFERTTGQPHNTVLKYRTEHPDASSERMAEEIGARLGRPLSIHAIRQALHRARSKFAELFLREVARSLEQPTRQRIEEELVALEMLDYCKNALDHLYAK